MYFQKYAMGAYAIFIVVFFSNTSALALQTDSEPKANTPLVTDNHKSDTPVISIEDDTENNSIYVKSDPAEISEAQADLSTTITQNDTTELADVQNELADTDIINTLPAAFDNTESNTDNPNGELKTADNSSTIKPNSYSDKPLPRRSTAKSEKPDGVASKFSFDSIPAWSLRTLGALAIVIFLILFLRGLIRRFAGPFAGIPAKGGVLEILARYPFGKNQSLVLLKLDQKILLLCQTPQNVQTITEVNEPEDVASLLKKIRDDNGESFDNKLERLLKGNFKSKSFWGKSNSYNNPLSTEMTADTAELHNLSLTNNIDYISQKFNNGEYAAAELIDLTGKSGKSAASSRTRHTLLHEGVKQ